MDEKDYHLDSLRRVIKRLEKNRGDGFSDNMIEILQNELARHGIFHEPTESKPSAQPNETAGEVTEASP